MAWPKTVPVFDASMIRKGGTHSPDKTRCAVSWRHQLFGPPAPGSAGHRAYDAFVRATGVTSIAVWNDNPRTSKRTIARALNRMTALLDYTEGNPEAAWAAKHRKGA